MKKRRKRGLLVKIIFGGTQSMQSYVAGTWSTRRYAPGTWSTRRYAPGTQSTRSYLAGTWSTVGTLATSGLHSWYSVYDGELLAGTRSTDSINVNKGLWLVTKWSGRPQMVLKAQETTLVPNKA